VTIVDRLAAVRARVDAACREAGRDPAEVQLLAASKAQSAKAVREAYEAGHRLFGESYVQEWRAKAEDPLLVGLADLRWHFIGALQRNKAKYLLGRVACIESVGKASLAAEIARRSHAGGRTTEVLLSVNVGAEVTKAGFAPGDLLSEAAALVDLPGIRVRGLMAIPPPRETAKETRADHRLVRDLLGRLREVTPAADVLSLGMSGDYAEAIAAGATEVRIGTAIFGPR
jgi:hypothetical protein